MPGPERLLLPTSPLSADPGLRLGLNKASSQRALNPFGRVELGTLELCPTPEDPLVSPALGSLREADPVSPVAHL